MTMGRQQEKLALQEQALEWVMRLYIDKPDDGSRQEANSEFAQWLDSGPLHRQVWRETEQAWQLLVPMGGHPQIPHQVADAKRTVSGAPRIKTDFGSKWKRRLLEPTGITTAAVAACLLIAVLLAPVWVGHSQPQHYKTGVAEIATFELEDGSAITLGARSEIAVDFTPQLRRVTLKSGNAFFAVNKELRRPFVVGAGRVSVKVVGTQFDLHRGTREIRVGVLEGRVAVSAEADFPEGRAANAVLLQAGQQVSATGSRLSEVKALDALAMGGWRQGRLSYNRASLAEIVADANRYSDKPIALADPALGALTLSTSYQVDKLNSMLKSLEAVQPVVVVETPLGILIKPKSINNDR